MDEYNQYQQLVWQFLIHKLIDTRRTRIRPITSFHENPPTIYVLSDQGTFFFFINFIQVPEP